ncbi:MAG: protein translocase subunit SecF [Candidatus Levyibacteriota bacterium]
MNIIRHKNWLFLLSGIVIVPGLISLIFFGLKPSIDFTGGSRTELNLTIAPEKTGELKSYLVSRKIPAQEVIKSAPTEVLIRTQVINQKQKDQMVNLIKEKYPQATERSFETVGATIGQETELNALRAVLIASLAITLYIAFAFRKVSRPVASWKFGICAIVALLHDILVVVGIFSILGVIFRVEIDALFITALLTVMGFSVHDTIVVFDRIRENLRKNARIPFEEIVNNSILETMNRSLNTSLTVVLVLFMLMLFGGESTRWFIAALLVGIISGTYSSIFNASPLLVLWYEFDKKRKNK